MKYLLLSLILSFLQFSYAPSSVASSFFEKASSQNLKILGSGVKDRKTGSVLALACESTCDQLRFVYFMKNEVYFIGESMSVDVDQDGNPETKKLNRKLRKLKKESQSSFHILPRFLTITAAGGLGYYLFGVLSTATIGWASAPLVATMLLFGVNDFYGFIHSMVNGGVVEMNNQSGWNWSIRPKGMRHKDFANLVLYLMSPPGSGVVDSEMYRIWMDQSPYFYEFYSMMKELSFFD